jgi:ABC-type branched-subunit amino acid transport system ATPase component
MADKKRKRWERPQILSDLPLRETDKAHFHFDDFAGTLALLVADPQTRTPLAVGISGPWGAGKTTLLQRVKTLLETRDKDGRPFFASEGETAKDFRTCKRSGSTRGNTMMKVNCWWRWCASFWGQ